MQRERLLLNPQRRYRTGDDDWEGYKKRLQPSLGLDIETDINGNAFCISDSLGRRDSTLWRPPDLDTIIRWLVKEEHRQSLCFFFNAKFDAEAILKRLWRDELIELLTNGKITIERGGTGSAKKHLVPWQIGYIPELRLSIRRPNDKRWNITIFDLAQYYPGLSLDLASKTFLKGTGKIELESKDFRLEDVDKDKDRIIRYNRADAFLAKRLADRMRKSYTDLKVYSCNFLSPATLAERDFINHEWIPKTVDEKDHVVDSIPEEVFNLCCEGFRGGWIEAQKRGYIKKGYLYDCNSLYPFIMRDLVNPCNRLKGEGRDYDPLGSFSWKHTNKYTKSKKVLYGIYRIEVELETHTISPIPLFGKIINFKGAKRSIYPYGQFETIVGQDALEFMIENLKGDYKILDAWEFFTTVPEHIFRTREYLYPLRRRIDELYQRKLELKRITKTNPQDLKAKNEYNIIKRHLNSIYGKFSQRTATRVYDEKSGILRIDKERTGQLFNPIWAFLITEKARIHVAKEALKDPEAVALIMTDSLLTIKPLKDIRLGEGLGEWTQEQDGKEALIVMSGAYCFKGETPFEGLTKQRVFGGLFASESQKRKYKDTGLPPGLYYNFFDALEAHRDKNFIDVIPRRPLRLKASMVKKLKEDEETLEIDKNFSTKDVCKFLFFPSRVKLVDYKRHWTRPPLSCGELLTKTFQSEAWDVTPDLDGYRILPISVDIEKEESLIDRVIKKGGIKLTSVINDFGKYSDLPLRVRRKGKLPFDEMADELGMTENELWEALIYKEELQDYETMLIKEKGVRDKKGQG